MDATFDKPISDFGREMLSVQSARELEIWRLQNSVKQRAKVAKSSATFEPKPGVSIIVATHGGQFRIGHLLDSLISQSLESSRFEVIIIENGSPDGTSELIRQYNRRYPQYNFRYFWRQVPSAGGARNLGINLAQLSRTTFVDDDDVLEPDYLRSALTASTGTNIVVSPIINVHPDGTYDEFNSLNDRIGMLRGSKNYIAESPWLLGFNACKLVPTWMIKHVRYREDLKSGEDVIFWAQLLMRAPVEVVVAPGLTGNAYRRALRANSVSRQTLSRDFSVSQRIDCIKALGAISVEYGSQEAKCVAALRHAQAGFIVRYIDEHPEDHDSVVKQINRSNVPSFPWGRLNKGKATEVAFLYCFAPFADTSAVVASKAIAERQNFVDVFTNDMSSVRNMDAAASALADQWIGDRTMISAPPSFANWQQISDYAIKSVKSATDSYLRNGGYSTVYSRALWAGSHVAAALFKLRYGHLEWTAEFSDPLRRDANGSMRSGELSENSVFEELASTISSRGYNYEQFESLFEFVEVATFVLSDSIVFTNSNQMEFMLSITDNQRLRREVASKAIVRPHPTPPADAYSVSVANYKPPIGKINIAYFGTFYPNRGIGDVLLALANSPAGVRQRVRLHVFSNSKIEVESAAFDLGVSPIVHSNDYLPYMEFLNATTKFDILLVNDVEKSENLSINPFLPSKLSDYRGSGSKIWAIVEGGSAMSRMHFDYISGVASVPGIVNTLKEIVASEHTVQ